MNEQDERLAASRLAALHRRMACDHCGIFSYLTGRAPCNFHTAATDAYESIASGAVPIAARASLDATTASLMRDSVYDTGPIRLWAAQHRNGP